MNYLNQLTEQLSDGVYVIKVPLPGNPLKNINSYVIKGKERNLIVDTAFNMPECLMAFELGLTVLGVDMRNTDIFLTHLHSDHTGLAASIASPESRVFISREDRVRLENFMEKEYWEQVYDVYKSYGFSEKELEEISVSNPASIYMPKIKIKYCDVENGHIIDLGGRKLTCISTPGHTPGHMCLYDEANGILFCGDLMLFDITPNITSWSNFDNPLAQYLNSLNKIKDLDIKQYMWHTVNIPEIICSALTSCSVTMT
jgi:glyoxylase-like metal-dependent hydrolase (beta-lactamase superfamily II)